ncbi:MAG: DUF362 domain-containing protein [Akkermansiaceae bacterium]|nr:DUF362 domain-containing protein [Akkermansiaceae bacterium]
MGFGVGAAFSLETLSGLFPVAAAAEAPAAGAAAAGTPALVAVRGNSRVAMLDAALEALGGISAFVKPGQTVVIKPNCAWDKGPELSANTHPDLVGRVVKLCREAGAARVVAFDHSCDAWQRVYRVSGIQEAVEKNGGEMLSGADEGMYREHANPQARNLKSAKVHKAILDSDVYINMPVLKHHGGARMTACMKNAMGLVWDRGFFHSHDLHQCIADSVLLRKPDLNILDAFAPMLRNGPKGKDENDLISTKALLAGTDIVAVDAAASKLLGNAEGEVRHIDLAAEMGLGEKDLSKVVIKRITLT